MTRGAEDSCSGESAACGPQPNINPFRAPQSRPPQPRALGRRGRRRPPWRCPRERRSVARGLLPLSTFVTVSPRNHQGGRRGGSRRCREPEVRFATLFESSDWNEAARPPTSQTAPVSTFKFPTRLLARAGPATRCARARAVRSSRCAGGALGRARAWGLCHGSGGGPAPRVSSGIPQNDQPYLANP